VRTGVSRAVSVAFLVVSRHTARVAQATTLESDLAPAAESRSGKPDISVVVTI